MIKTVATIAVIAAIWNISVSASAHASVTVTYIACPAEYAGATLGELERGFRNGKFARVDCISNRLVAAGKAALPIVEQLLLSDGETETEIAIRTIPGLGDVAGEIFPALVQRLRRATLQGVATSDYDPLIKVMGAIGALKTRAQAAAPEMADLLRNTRLPSAIRRPAFDYFWQFTEGNDEQRLVVLPDLLVPDTLVGTDVKIVAAYLEQTGSRAHSLAPLLLKALSGPDGAQLIEAYMAVAGHEDAIPQLVSIVAKSPHYLFTNAVGEAFKKRATPDELDRHFGNAARDPAHLPGVLTLIKAGIASPATVQQLSDGLRSHATFEAAIDGLMALGDHASMAQQSLLTLARHAIRTNDPRRTRLLLAVRSSGASPYLETGLLAMEAKRELAASHRISVQYERGTCGKSCQPPACTAASMLGSNERKPAFKLAFLKTAYFQTQQDGNDACRLAVTLLVHELNTPQAARFLLVRLLESQSLDEIKMVSRYLGERIHLIVPLLEKTVASLDPHQLMIVEAMLAEAPRTAFFTAYQQRVLPELLAQAVRSDAGDIVGVRVEDDRRAIGIAAGVEAPGYPVTRGGIAVRRIGQLTPVTRDMFLELLRVAAGPFAEAADEAVALLMKHRSRDPSLRRAQYREVVATLAATSDAIVKARLLKLQSRLGPTWHEQTQFPEDAANGH